jgi:hypothetical protein
VTGRLFAPAAGRSIGSIGVVATTPGEGKPMPASLMVPPSLLAVLGKLRVFTAPGFTTFTAMVTGLVAQTGAGTVTGMLTGAGLARAWPHDRAHAFFSRTRWNVDNLGIVLAHLIVGTLLPQGAAITVAVDDTLFKRSGKKVFGAAWQHDGAARGPKPVGRGTCFVVVGIVVELPFLTRPVCLPVMARLWRPKTGPSKVELAASMVRLLAVCLDRPLHVVADAAYHGRALRHLPEAITLTTRLPACAVLFDLAPPPTGKRGRPRLKGVRLGTPAELAETATFTTGRVARYGRTDQVRMARGPLPLVRLLPHPGRPRHPDPRRGHHHRLRPGPGHHRPCYPGRGAGHPIRLAVVHRDDLRRGPHAARRRTGPQPLRERGPPHRPVRPVLLLDHRRLVRIARPPSQRRRRPPRTSPLVHHQDRPVLR